MARSDLQDKVALITGGSRSIGAAIAVELAGRGAKVVVNFVSNATAAKDVVRVIESNGGTAISVQADVSEQSDVVTLIDETVKRFERIDILVNNAAMQRRQPFPNVDPIYFHEMFGTNVLGPIMVTQASLPHFPASGGRIINLSSRVSFSGGSGDTVYAATKAAVRRLTRSFAKELGPRNITVNCVAPGMIETEGSADLPPGYRERTLSETPLGRIGQSDDIAAIVGFLASGESRWLTGRTLLADGGKSDYW
ncbi:MAG: 3-oxoacyl-ACP reductase family protein [Phenylobacterium sp.]|uniref:SDR family NAD(P)-dependent oxidoreductase n=1 Tax=Phenylobacterium sp. TaxID=1871053 RepID=UPI0027369B1A|nr:3-oxoacyl-ACP reductase family protein [Phenylobacterium sp.]MDP3173907.1 3-oxoacyl-ACP reductase family protein [Phenylobacterium sp.]